MVEQSDNAIPVPKYRVGQTVFYGTVTESKEAYDCPDCLGSGVWELRSPAGATMKAKCPRCEGHKQLSLRSVKGEVHEVKIQGIQLRTSSTSYDEKVKYEFNRSGGCYSHMNESDLLATREAAQTSADAKAAARNEELNNPETPDGQRRAEFRELSRYQMIEAATKESESRTWRAKYELERMIARIAELNIDSYLLSPSAFKEDLDDDEAKEYMSSGKLDLNTRQIALLQEHIVGYSPESVKELIRARAEAKECKCP